MSITIRLAKIGRKNTPAYRIVVANTKDKRNGRFVDIVGNFNPSMKPQTLSVDQEKYKEWINKGALVSKAVKDLVAGTYKFVPYKPGKDKQETPANPEA